MIAREALDRRTALSLRRGRLRDWLWLPVGLAAVYALIELVRLPAVIAGLYANSDIASAPVIGSLLHGTAADGGVTLGNYPWYEGLWFIEGTRWLPAHRQLIELAPILGSVAAVAAALWASWRTLGAWAAAITAAVLVSTSNSTRLTLFTWTVHGGAVVHGCVLGAALVWVARRPHVRTSTLIFVGAALAAFTAIGEASDRLVVATAIAPFLAASVLTWARARSRDSARLAVWAVAVVSAAVIGGELLVGVMRGEHVIPSQQQFFFVANGVLAGQLQQLAGSFADLGGGYFFGQPITLRTALEVVAAALTLTAAAAVLRGCWRRAPRLTAPADGAPIDARETHLTFWASTLAFVSLAFVFASSGQTRYLVAAFVAAAILLPAFATTALARGALAVGVAVFVVVSAIAFVRDPVEDAQLPNGGVSGQLERYALAHGLRYGYAGYWDAASLTWATGLRLRIFPVADCPGSPTKCPSIINHSSAWYVPRPHTPTFLIVDLKQPADHVAGPNPADGPPVAVQHIEQLVVYVYDHDIGATMQHY